MDYLYLFLLLIEVIVLVTLEKRKWGTILTPFCVLALTFTGVALIAIIYSSVNDKVKDFYIPSLWIWEVGLLFFYLPSLFYVNPLKNCKSTEIIMKGNNLYDVLVVVTSVFIIIGLYKVHTLRSQFDFGTDDFGDGMGNSGLLAHITMFLTGAFAYFVCMFNKKHKYAIVPIVLIIIIMFAQASKTRTLTPLLTGAFASVMCGKIKFNGKSVVLIILCSLSFFFIAYYLSLVATGLIVDMKDFWDFIFTHFMDYFIGAPLSFSLDYEKGIIENENIMGLFKPLMLVIDKIFGSSSVTNFVNEVVIDMGALGSTNVRTFFGTLYVYTQSIFLLAIITYFLSFYIYYFFYIARKNRNIFLIIISALNLTYLVFGGFFDYYWAHLYPYEIVIIFYFLYAVSKCKIHLGAVKAQQTC